MDGATIGGLRIKMLKMLGAVGGLFFSFFLTFIRMEKGVFIFQTS